MIFKLSMFYRFPEGKRYNISNKNVMLFLQYYIVDEHLPSF